MAKQRARNSKKAAARVEPFVAAELERELGQRVEAAELSLASAFANLLFTKAPPEFFEGRSPETLAGLALGAFRMLQRARPERVNVQVVNPEPSSEGWRAPVTVVRTIVSERPFIVDTIRECLHAQDLAIERFLHPVLRVERDAQGRVVALGPASSGEPRESLVHCEISRIEDPARLEQLRAMIEAHLQDVVRATQDFEPMLGALDDTVRYLGELAERSPEHAAEAKEIQEFLSWLKGGSFVFLGYRGYDIARTRAGKAITVEPGSGLGVLREESESSFASSVLMKSLPEGLRERVSGGPLLIISKTNATSTVHRLARMDYVGVKKLDERGRIVGERRFIGLFTSVAYSEDAERIPILRQKLRQLIHGAGLIPGSHDYKETITIFNSMPKEELFLTSAEEIGAEIQAVLALYHTHEVRVTLRPDPLERGVSVMVVLPKENFSGEVRKSIEQMFVERFAGEVLNYHLALGGGDQARLHFYISATPEHVAAVEREQLEAAVERLTRSWSDRLRAGLEAVRPGEDARVLAQRYAAAFSPEYRAATEPDVAEQDVLELEAMDSEGRDVAIALSNPALPEGIAVDEPVSELKLYLRGRKLVLSEFMPILDHAGLRVIAMTPFEVAGKDVSGASIYVFAVQDRLHRTIDLLERAGRLSELILAVRAGRATNDALNALVLAAGLSWREVDVLRAYAAYAFQLEVVPSRLSLVTALLAYPDAATLVVRLFATRFDPDLELTGAQRAEQAASIRREFIRSLEGVSSLSDDRALRRLLALAEATVRTNYYRRGGARPDFESGGAPYISLKFASALLQGLVRSRLRYEVWVHSARMAGVHLRGANVARGGIRYSDRPDDFRTEILGLVRTQMVKNAVIVPSGSKGGFITKLRLEDRDAMATEVAAQYRTLMRGLLDVTDNLVDGAVVHPPRVLFYDEPDPYLVVAADKGTAHLSDVANGVAAEYDYWLGDAFASGGSHGYDHKAVGITARGAWECVEHHFRELGRDIQKQPFTVVGIGDMSGDVFGNGMLLSREIRLIAAFDHRHIFVDPDPDPASSFAERERLFHAGRTSWDDYDRKVLGRKGFIVPRGVKEVTVTPEVRAALGLGDDVETLDGESLVHAILGAPVDLLWNGGIGTYVKASFETNAEVGDSANDAVRIDAPELRAKVVGEGGNLGLTQRARIEYALAGGRLNTDAIDNSGGVDMSDHEVNLKILLGSPLRAGAMTMDARNALLKALTEDVTTLVLWDNQSQSLALSLEQQRAGESVEEFHALMSALEREGLLDRATDVLPSREELEARRAEGATLTRPELSVLLAHAKLAVKQEILAGDLPDDEAASAYLVSYFPAGAVEAAGAAGLSGHRLRREIIASHLTNDLVDLMGSAFVSRMARDTGHAGMEVVRAWLIAARLCGARALRGSLDELAETLSSAQQNRWMLGLERVLERTVRWVLGNVPYEVPAEDVIAEHLEPLARLRERFADIVAGEERGVFEARIAEIRELVGEPDLARRLITLRFLDQLLEILRVARETGGDPLRVGRAYYLTSELLSVPWLRQTLFEAASDDQWEQRATNALADDVGRAHRLMTEAVLAEGGTDESVDELLERVCEERARPLAAYRTLLDEIRNDERRSLSALSIAIRELHALCRPRAG